ncbi:MAG: shikimate dehydrogenase family protein, partial [Gemmatimonadales bacterium]
MIGGSTRVFAILGQPVSHSLSPAMHNAAFRALGLDAVYVAIPCETPQVAPLMRTLAAAQGGGNVTAPHKEAARRAADRESDMVSRADACNTFFGRGGALHAENTDVVGVAASLSMLESPSSGVLILGTGGAARAATLAAIARSCSVAVRSRSDERRAAFERWVESQGGEVAVERECRSVVNATPLGHGADDPLPAEPAGLPPVEVVIDLIYRKGETPWVRAMRARGARAADGRIMLISQGAAAFNCWFPEE